MNKAGSPETPDASGRVLPEAPAYRPLERFWPYADLPEQPTEEELAALHPELRAVLFGAPVIPFSLSLVFSIPEGQSGGRALELARASDEFAALPGDGPERFRARFFPGDRPERLRDLYDVVGGWPGTEVLVDDRPVPYARELWLPLVWFLIR